MISAQCEKALSTLAQSTDNKNIQVVIASGFHLFPFRTEKLSPIAPMVLRRSGRVGRRLFFKKEPVIGLAGFFFALKVRCNKRIDANKKKKH